MAKGDESGSMIEDGVVIEVKKLGNNSRTVRSKIAINASLETVWNVMTDYEKFTEFVPGLTECKILEKKGNFVRIFQNVQQNLPLGMKIKSKIVLDCVEKDIEISASGKKRDIEFTMAEGDFQSMVGKWSMEEVIKPRSEESGTSVGQEFETTFSYIVDVKPKPWLPIQLVEGKLCREVQTNLREIRNRAQKMTR